MFHIVHVIVLWRFSFSDWVSILNIYKSWSNYLVQGFEPVLFILFWVVRFCVFFNLKNNDFDTYKGFLWNNGPEESRFWFIIIIIIIIIIIFF